MTDPLAASVTRAGTALVQPPSERFAAVDVDGAVVLRRSLDLGGGRHLAVVADGSGRRWTAPLVATDDAVRRAVAGDGVAEALVAWLVGRGHDLGSSSFERQHFAGRVVSGERAVTVDQTNESLVVGEAAVVKWSTALPPVGSSVEHPAPARLAALAAAGFTGTPTPWGVVSVDDGDGPPLVVATVTEHLPGALDGWDWAVDDLRQHVLGGTALGEATAPARALGDLVAGMHLALATAGTAVATADDAAGWAQGAAADLARATQLVDGPEGDRLSASAPRVAAEVASLASFAGATLMPVHGDLHVGQVLRRGAQGPATAYAVIDFDGNPVLPPEQRAAWQPAAVDVAGMLASLDHVGRVVVERTDGIDADAVDRWTRAAREAFLDRYRAVLAEADRRELLDGRLIRPLLLQQECREFVYAVEHLPVWRYVPDRALAALLAEDDGPGGAT